MLMHYDPFRELDRLTQQLPGPRTRPAVIPIDAYRRGNKLIVHFDLPGVDPEAIELTVEKNVMTVKAERFWPLDEGDEILVSERQEGSFNRQLFLGEGLDVDRVSAGYDQGVLTVSIPVAETAKPRKVAISGSGDGEVIEAVSKST